MTKPRVIILLSIMLLIGAVFRFTGIEWDRHTHLHPDERFLTMVTTGISWPRNLTEYLDTLHSPANPHNKGFSFYVYGTYPVLLTKLVSDIFSQDTYEGIPTVGRALSGIADLITLVMVFLMARRLATRITHASADIAGLVAAYLYATLVLPIQLSHFFTVDPLAILFLTVSLYRLIDGAIDAPLGIAVGLAVAAKVSSVLILPIVAIVFLTRWPWKRSATSARIRLGMLGRGIMFALTFLGTVRLLYPYLFIGWALNPKLLSNWQELKAFDGPMTMFPPALQWIGVSVWQPLWDLVVWGMGIPAGIIGVIGVILGLRKPATRIVTCFILLVIAYQSMQFAKAMRYLYPVYPAIAALIGVAGASWVTSLHARRLGIVTWLAGIILLLWPIAFVSIYRSPQTRIAASEWIYAHIPEGSVLSWEHWDDPLPLSIGTDAITRYATIQLTIYDPDTPGKWQRLSQDIAGTDYIILSSNRVYGGTGRANVRYPITSTYYRLLFSGGLGFEKVAEFASRPHIPFPGSICLVPPGFSYGAVNRISCPPGLSFIDDFAEESFTVYDHPKVTVFRNILHYPSDTIFRRITEGQRIP